MTATISGIISGDYSVTKDRSGNLILTGANEYTGSTTVSAGTLQLAANARERCRQRNENLREYRLIANDEHEYIKCRADMNGSTPQNV